MANLLAELNQRQPVNLLAELQQPEPTQAFNPMTDISAAGITAEDIFGAANLAQNVATGMIARPIAGGVAIQDVLQGEGLQGAETVKELTGQIQTPLTEEGKAVAGKIGEGLKTITQIPGIDKIIEMSKNAGDFISSLTQATGALLADPLNAAMSLQSGDPLTARAQVGANIGGALSRAIPETALEVSGFRGASKVVGPAVKSARPPTKTGQAAVDAVEASEKATGIKQLTTDVFPPTTRTGGFMQQQGEVIAGGQRAGQQVQRVDAVEKVLKSFNVEDAARFEADIFEGLKASISKKKAAAGDLIKNSSDNLAKLGDVSINRTKKKYDV